MALPKPRDGESGGFSFFPWQSEESTIGDPEKIIWSSINHLCAKEVADMVLFSIYGIKEKSIRFAMASNLKVYLNQANEFYQAAQNAKSNTAPLFFYYAFLNLAKAVCEIKKPNFHQTNESYRHGISWTPSKDYLVNMEKEFVNLTTRGVWHELYEAVIGSAVTLRNPTKLQVKDLFAYSIDTNIEYEKTYYKQVRLVRLINIDTCVGPEGDEYWIRFSVNKDNLKDLKLTRPKFLEIFTYGGSKYIQVQSEENDFLWTFELEKPKKIPKKKKEGLFRFIKNEVKAMNLFITMVDGNLIYNIPDQRQLPLRLPQISVLYSLIFWLGSLVRYDPHSVAELRDSRYWLLIDGFLSQSRIWLLELFEWQLFQEETTLKSMR